MKSLAEAHKGYEYQDLLVACRFVDMLLGNLRHVDVDVKLFPDDKYDDLTIVDIIGNRERFQFKHTENADRPLSIRTFTSDDRGLRLDRLVAAALADRVGPGSTAKTLTFRIVLRDQAPSDPDLTAVLITLKNDPGPFIPTMHTLRLGFDAEALWNQRNAPPNSGAIQPFSFLFDSDPSPNLEDLHWFCQHLVVEVNAPPSSGDLTAPNTAESLLLSRMRSDVGAETFPNRDRTSIDVAAALVSAARAARQGRLTVTVEELLRRAQLRSDFGAVSRAHPVDQALEVLRPSTVGDLVRIVTERADVGGHMIIVGPPGHGKSWVCQQLLKALCEEGWITAEHYCYLGDADGERLERVLAETIMGSLIGRLAETDPRLVTDHRPRFAADEEALIECVKRSFNLEPERRVALVIDGIDHITRVRASNASGFDPSRSLAEILSSLELPPKAIVIVLSQPGSYLEPLKNMGAKFVEIPGLNENELKLLAARLNVIPADGFDPSLHGAPLIQDAKAVVEFLGALIERSAGNALYATYLCREILRLGDNQIDAAATVRNLPPFDGTLENYYDHIYRSLGVEAGWVADVIALVDFALTRVELQKIRPDAAHRVDEALEILKPVLIERATQGGVRIYHESFARYLRKPFQDNPIAFKALLEHIAVWLEGEGFFLDPRAFRSLLTILSEMGQDAKVIDLVDRTFVVRAVEVGFPLSAIKANLALAIGSAARRGNWAAITRYVELQRAADSFESERFDTTLVKFADVPATLLGVDILAARLVDNDHLAMPAREGLQMCAAVDELGGVPPWRMYMNGFRRETNASNTSYGKPSNQAVTLAWLRGRLRLATVLPSLELAEDTTQGKTKKELIDKDDGIIKIEQVDFESIDLAQVAKMVEENDLPVKEVIRALEDTHGLNCVVYFIPFLQNPGRFCLALAERLNKGPTPDAEIGTPQSWANKASTYGTSVGSMHRLLKLGVEPASLTQDSIDAAREKLFDLTRHVQNRSIRWEDEEIFVWADACALAAYLDPIGLNAAEALIVGYGWYRCWLRFTISLLRAEANTGNDRGMQGLDALHLLLDDLDPFSGDPRSCDLYSLHSIIQNTISRAMCLLDDMQWEVGLSILKKVSASITTTLSGELGGPVPPDFLLRIATEGANAARHNAVESLIENEIKNNSAHHYYADLAEFRLYAARLALATSDRNRAQDLWHEACTFLTAYGWHKDITIYELLDPLPTLIKADPTRARGRISAIQGLCERVPLHTDRKETSHAWDRWWQLLAKADPVATVSLAVPQLLSKCNDPNWLLDGAIEDVWQEWHEKVDPLISGTLRLTLDPPLYPIDVGHMEYLAKSLNTENPVMQRLMSWLFARVDERPVTYEYSNSAELVAKDNDVVAALNKIAETINLWPVEVIDKEFASRPSQGKKTSSIYQALEASEDSVTSLLFPPGFPGLGRAIRAWRNQPYGADSQVWIAERYANIIGYRLIELAAEGQYKEAKSALRALVDGSRARGQFAILRLIAEGLERHGEIQLAAFAYALIWTRTQGHGGWLTFGGETEIEALRHATVLDSNIARATVAEEVQLVVATSYFGTYGISQALIYAFSVEALKEPDIPAIDTAFAAWDEAFAIIEARAPWVDPSDDPDHRYFAPTQDNGEAAPGDLDGAFALATLGGLAHPGREKKRRTFLAIQLLLNERAAIGVTAFKTALSTISDLTTLTWLLHQIELSNDDAKPVREECQEVFRKWLSCEFLTVRALARRLVIGEQPPLVPPTSADSALLGSIQDVPWVPASSSPKKSSKPSGVGGQIQLVAGTRLRQAEIYLPGLSRAVLERAENLLGGEMVKNRLRSQLNHLTSRIGIRWPDAFLAAEQTIEETIQAVAAGGRTARLMAGNPISSPILWEDELASVLLNDPDISLTLETLRQPRPSFAPPPTRGHRLWTQAHERASGNSSRLIEEALEHNGDIFATIVMKPADSVPVVEHGIYKGWRWLGYTEKRLIQHPDWNHKGDLISRRYHVFEIRDYGDRQALTLPPIAVGDLRVWKEWISLNCVAPLINSSQPLIGEDIQLKIAGDSHQGLGLPDSLLTPTPILISLLNLQPGESYSYRDKEGIGLALVIWRAEYATSENYMAWPRISGSGIVIRPDLFARIAGAVGEHRLVLRDFIMGNLELMVAET